MRGMKSLNSAAFRFALLIAGMFALGSMVLLVVLEQTTRTYAQEATAVGLRSEMAVLMQDWPEDGRSAVIDTIAQRRRSPYEQPFRYVLLGSDGRRLAGDLPARAARPGWGSVTFTDDPGSVSERSDTEVLSSLGRRLADGSLLVVATDTFDVQALRHRLAAYTIWSSVGITMLALIGGYGIGLVFLRRLERVNGAVARIMSGDLAERLPTIGMSPEFDHLSRNLNAMLDRLGASMAALRQVSTDIAHDLRTPLTRLQQRLETMRGSTSIATYEAEVDGALAQIDEIHAIFRALLRIGMIEGGERGEPLVPTDLSELLTRVTEAYRPVVEDAEKVLHVDLEPAVQVLGDGALLAQLFTNLLDNALVHTPEGTIIAVTLHRDGDRAVVTVADDGPGVPSALRGKIVTRFFRLDRSRHTPGAGLGLALVASIAAYHHATLAIEDNDPGLRVRLTVEQLNRR